MSELQLTASAALTGKAVSIVAYSGDMMKLAQGLYLIDLAGLEIGGGQTPLLCDHGNVIDQVIGHVNAKVASGELLASGLIVPGTEAADRIIAMAKSGHAWQASVGVQVDDQFKIKEGQSFYANGRTHVAPEGGLNVATRSKLLEISIVTIGANIHNTNVTIQAKGSKDTMTKTVELEAQEQERRDSIRAVCGEHRTIEARAIDEMWDVERTELEVLREWKRNGKLEAVRASYPDPPNPHIPTGQLNATPAQTLEAAALIHAGRADLAEELGPEVAQMGESLKATSMLDLCARACQLEMVDHDGSKSGIIKAAFSTMSLPVALSNASGKSAWHAYSAYPSVARQIAKTLSVNDLKEATGIRLTADFKLKTLPPGGEIRHTTLGESTYPFQADTFARMLGVERKTIVNDDASVLSDIPAGFGRGAAASVEKLFWTMVLSNQGNFFSTGNGNLLSGAETALGIDGVSGAVTALMAQTDEQGDPIALSPKFIVVPPALKPSADVLHNSLEVSTLNTVTSDYTVAANPHAKQYQPLVTPWLDNANAPGGSSTGWYLIANPADVPAFGLCFLDGVDRPHVESDEADFNTLGLQWRCWWDYGVAMIDPKAVVKSDGV